MSNASSATRTLLMHLTEGVELPDGLGPLLEDEAVAAGTLRGHGILVDASIRVYSPLAGGMGTTRTLAGESQLVILDGTIGMSGGRPTAELRAVLSRETEMGVETFAGALVAGRVVQGEIFVLALDDVAIALDAPIQPRRERASVDVPSSTPRPSSFERAPAERAPVERAPERAPVERAPSPWADAAKASAPAVQANPKSPPRPPTGRAVVEEEGDGPFPDHGDHVDHFAFGACEVLKGDGDRIHVRVGKDGRIREIALEMLKMTLTSAPDARPRRFRLERKL